MTANREVESPYRIEKFDLSQLEAVRKLHLNIYGWAPEAENFRRKYETEALGHSVIGFAAYDQSDELVAYYGVFPVRLQLRNKIILAAQSGDTMTHPLHQGRGLFVNLARHTYKAATMDGIAFVFGFPNQNSYPGFVKKLGWSHQKYMQSYNLIIPTFPLLEIVQRFKKLLPVSQRIQALVVSMLGVSLPTALKNSVVTSEVGGVLRNSAYLNYKKNGLYHLNTNGVDIYFKLGRYIDVGDIYCGEKSNLKAALRKLKLIAFLTGSIRVRFYVSPDTVADKQLATFLKPRNGLPYGHVTFDSTINPDNFSYTFIDYDTY